MGPPLEGITAVRAVSVYFCTVTFLLAFFAFFTCGDSTSTSAAGGRFFDPFTFAASAATWGRDSRMQYVSSALKVRDRTAVSIWNNVHKGYLSLLL